MKISRILLHNCKAEKQKAREQLANANYDIQEVLKQNLRFLSRLRDISLSKIDRKIKRNEDLTFEEAFCGNCYTLSATNRVFYQAIHRSIAKAVGGRFSPEQALASGTAFLELMATKEALNALQSEEIAGLAAAGLMDTVVRLYLGETVTETCGMGGDIGIQRNGKCLKTINISTLSAIVLASLGVPTVKHGSYGNTSTLGSTEVIESFGAQIAHSSIEEVLHIWKCTRFCFFDAHWCKTIHDLSHLLRLETINHIVGPMTPPIHCRTRINKLMGVNEKVHPEVIVRAYAELHSRKLQTVGGVVVVTGLEKGSEKIDPTDKVLVRSKSVLDEVSPFATVVSVGYGEKFIGTDLLTPSDFGVSIEPDAILIQNIPENIKHANYEALSGKNSTLTDYLAMNSALALFASCLSETEGFEHGRLKRKLLQRCFRECHRAIKSGAAIRKLREYVRATGGKFTHP